MSVDDAALLADVLAFLDDFDAHAPHESPQPSESSSAPRTSPNKPKGGATARDRRSDKNSARLALYWRKKHELQALRDEVRHLSRRLEVLKQCATTELEVEAAERLGVTLRRAKVDWRRNAEQQRVLRARAERTNAELRRLLRTHRQWTNNAALQLRLGDLGAVEANLANGHTNATDPGQSLWMSVFRYFLDEARAIVELDPADLVHQFDWTGAAALSSALPKPAFSWTTSFAIPVNDPHAVGEGWWRSILNLPFSPGLTTPFPPLLAQQDAPRVQKKPGWPVTSECGRVSHVSGRVLFEANKGNSSWVLVAIAEVFDPEETTMLFRTTALRAISRTPGSRTCTFQGRYQVFDVDHAPGNASGQASSRFKQHAMNSWKYQMGIKDERLGLMFTPPLEH